ncbi:MAG: hypothetical protein IJ774_09200 [Selenomonadaceae bacterium]|nr:hypothetical protein [Selenomonadaceae bacterium]
MTEHDAFGRFLIGAIELFWDRQPGESYPAFEAFQTFLTHRNYSEVAALLHKSPTLIKRWARINSWRTRADAWDSELSRQALERASQDFAAMVERQINIGRMLQSRAANAIQIWNGRCDGE